MNSRVIVDDLGKAVERLSEALGEKPDNDLMRAGCIQYFEFCFELAWKSIKMIAAGSGANALTSPKACLRHAFATGWIDDEAVWLEMLAARNQMSHTYDAAEALGVYESLSQFAPALDSLRRSLEQQLGSG